VHGHRVKRIVGTDAGDYHHARELADDAERTARTITEPDLQWTIPSERWLSLTRRLCQPSRAS
jgi:hypothetical protein